MDTRICASCGGVTYNPVMCADCIHKGITVESVKDFSDEDLKWVKSHIIKARETKMGGSPYAVDVTGKDKQIAEHDLVLEMIDARLYPNNFIVGC
jgi:hypothetical protein